MNYSKFKFLFLVSGFSGNKGLILTLWGPYSPCLCVSMLKHNILHFSLIWSQITGKNY